MADLRPFRGWYYDCSKADASQLLAPPYDVLDDAERKALAAKHDKNSVRVILPEGDGDAKYPEASRLLESWRNSGALVQSQRPAVYRYHQVFEHPLEPGRTMTRRGFIAAVRLHDFAERIILPHERTLKGPKIDRLKLMDATRTHTSQIFTLYSDPSGTSDQLFEAVERTEPTIDGVTDDGTRHRMWECSDAELIGDLRRIVGPLSLYIADGHHRYETMLAMRKQIEGEHGGLSANSSANFGTLFVANMSDPGMVVLPTHRLIHSVGDFDAERMLSAASERFEMHEIDPQPGVIRDALARADRPAFAAVFPARRKATVMVLRKPPETLKGVLGELDVSVLHSLVLEDILGIDKAAQAAKTNIEYLKTDGKAMAAIEAGKGQVCFMMRATPVSQVKACSDAGEFMPQKSTFFV
ncbi:MAG: DUF1015 domain-containing protein, partial [Deltaproteobacteria bacterium]|nr:DUF1015 domain-containing protein [Deltaproteobacteria bacterium]